MIPQPEVRFVDNGGVNLAYQVAGDGPVDLVQIPGFVSHLECEWEEPRQARFLGRLASMARLIRYDKRGTGLSDRVPPESVGGLDERVADVTAVLDAAGSERAVLLGYSDGGATAIAYAAAHPERVAAVILYGTMARVVKGPGYPCGVEPWLAERFYEAISDGWGEGAGLILFSWSLAEDRRFQDWWARWQRLSASRGTVARYVRMNVDRDVRILLRAVRSPTLVLHRERDVLIDRSMGHYLADHIRGAVYRELPGVDHTPFTEYQDSVLGAMDEFLGGVPVLGRLQSANGSRRRGPGWGWESLTRAEREIVRLVGEGRSNPEIAQALFVSRNTVVTHLKHVFTKLSVTSRTELAAEVVRRAG